MLLLCLYLLAALGAATNKFIWYDELVTVDAASLPSNHAIVNFFNAGRDTTSATCALIDHVALKLPIDPEISARLPFIMAFGLMFLFLYLFMRRRYPAAYALATPLLLFRAMRTSDLDVEARGYALLMMGTVLAMFCWQTATSRVGRRFPSLLGLWFGLALAINAHTFGVLLMVPFGLAEAWRDLRNQRVDWPVWVAFACFPLGLAPVIHGQLLANKYYGANFWAQPHLINMVRFLESKDFVAVAVTFLVFVVLRRFHLHAKEQTGHAGGFTPPEWLLCATLAVMPLYALPLSFLIHVYRDRYVIEFRVGCIVLIVALIAWLAGRSRQIGNVLFLLLLLYTCVTMRGLVKGGLQAAMHPQHVHERLVQRFNSLPWVLALRQSDLPVVAGDQVTYASLRTYADPELLGRLTVLTDIADLPQQPRSNTGQKNLVLFGPALGWQTEDVRPYLPGHPHFLLAGDPNDPGNWIQSRLQRMQAQGEATLVEYAHGATPWPGATMYDVHVTPAGVASFAQ